MRIDPTPAHLPKFQERAPGIIETKKHRGWKYWVIGALLHKGCYGSVRWDQVFRGALLVSYLISGRL
jgi:hypothetical protein